MVSLTSTDMLIDSLVLSQREIGGGKCYCLGSTKDCIAVPLEKQSVTECIVNSLDIQNADTILSLTENYLTETTLAFSSVCLKAFIAFLLNTTNPPNQKERVIYILRDQLELHPSCATYMFQTYEKLLLETEDARFKNLTSLDYVLSQLENTLSPRNASFSAYRTSRRLRKQCTYTETADSSPKKKVRSDVPKEAESSRDKSENEFSSKNILFIVLDILTEVLTHDLRAVIHCGQSVTKSILARLVFKGESSTLTYKALVYKVFETYKLCTKAEERRYVCRLLELIATLCLHVDEEQNEVNLLQPHNSTARFVTDFVVQVFDNEEISEERNMDTITCLNLVWLRYQAAHFMLQKLQGRHISKGFKGIVKELNIVLKSTKNETKSNLKALRVMDGNQVAVTAGINELITACRNDDLEMVKRLLEDDIDLNAVDSSGCTVLHIMAKHGSVKCVSFLLKKEKRKLNLELKDHKGFTPLMYAERGNHTVVCEMLTSYAGKFCEKTTIGSVCKKITPFVCKLMMVIVDTTIRMIESKYFFHREDSIQYLEKLIPLVKELSTMNNVPKELILLSSIFDKIEIVD